MVNTRQFPVIKHRRSLFFHVLPLIFLFCLVSRTDAQWTKIGSNVFFGPGIADNGGILGFKDGTLCGGTRKILISLDTGQTWKSIATLALTELAMSVDFFDSYHIIVKTNQKLYSSSDKGNTWSSQTIAGAYACFAGSPSKIVVCSNYSIYISTDAGTSWTKTHDAPAGSFMITCAKYKGNGVVIAIEDQHLLISTDYGATWKASNNYFSHTTDSWTLALSPCDSSTQVFVANENLGGIEKPSIFSTTNYGNTWQSLIQRPTSSLNGFITASGNSIFFETAVSSLQVSQGVFRSTNQGASWDSIGGPSTFYQDCRLIAPINNNTILACDHSGNIWRTDNAGGSPITSPAPAFTLPKAMTLKECQKDSSQIIITGNSCRRYHFIASALIGSDLLSFRLKGKNPPFILSDTARDTIGIIFDAKQLNGVLQDYIKISWYDEGEGIIRDTTIAIPVTVNPAAPNVTSSAASLQFDSVKLCMQKDTVITFRNIGCDTLNITTASLTPSNTITIDPIQLPLSLPTDSSVRIHVHFRSPVSGSFTATVQIDIEHRGLTEQISIPVSAFGLGAGGGLADKDSVIMMKPVTTCIPERDTVITIFNTGCDTLTVTSGPDGLGNGFSAVPLPLPLAIPSGKSLSVTIHFHPPGIGSFQTTASFTGDLEGFAQQKTIWLHCQNLGSNPGLTSIDSIVDFHNVSLCDSYRDTDIKLFNSGCDTLLLIGGPGNLTNGFSADPLSLPVRIPPDSFVTVHYHFHAQAPLQYKTVAIFIATADGKTQQLHQPLAGTGHVAATGPLVLQSSFAFDTISICSAGSDTLIWLANRSCDTLKISGGPGPLAAGFSGGVLSYPVILAPNDSIAVTFHFLPPGVGNFTANPKFNLDRAGLHSTFDFILTGSGKSEQGSISFYPKQLNFKPLSICAHDSAAVIIINSGCDSITVDPATIFGSPDFSSTSHSSSSLPPGDTLRYEVYITPAQLGPRQASFLVSSQLVSGIHRDTIPITVTIIAGTRILSTSVNALDFGPTTMCDEKDTTIRLANTGCDTLVIYSAGISGSGFRVSGIKDSIIILPGKDTMLKVFTVLDTLGGKTSNSAFLTFTSTSDTTLSPVILRRSYIAGIRRDLGVFLNTATKSGVDQSVVTYDIKESPGKPLSGTGVKQISFALNYNSSLLDFQASQSTPNLSLSGTSFVITGSPGITADANGVLASIGFRVYLTKDSVTTINMIKRTDTMITGCNITTVSQSGSAVFNYSFVCGERSISGLMSGIMPMKIISIHPNPAQDEIILDLQSAMKQDASIEIRNALGAKVYSGSKNVTSGSNSIHLDTKGLGAGAYVIRAGSANQTFVISR